MQVQEVSNSGLKREFTVKIPQADVAKFVGEKLAEIGKTARVDGFRPGKIPLPVLKQKFGDRVRAEVVEETVSNSIQKTLSERSLRPALQPQVEMVSFADGQDLEYKLAVEILPEIKPMDFSKLAFEKPLTTVPETAIDDTIQRVAKNMKEPKPIEKPRAAKLGDMAVIDFDGSVDGERRPGMKAEGHKIELGSKSFIDNFEDQIVGMKPGDSKDITVKFPDEYHAPELSGKKAVFAVKLHELQEHQPVTMDDELAKELGFATLAELRNRISNDIGADYLSLTRRVLKRRLMDALADKHDFPLPPGLIDAEFDAIWQQVQQQKTRGQLSAEDKAKSDDQLKKEYRAIAERRIRLGLLLAEVARSAKIEISPNDIRQAMIAEARRFPGQEKAVVDYYTKTEGALERLRAPLLEEKAVDHILAQAKVTEKTVSVDELTKLAEAAEA